MKPENLPIEFVDRATAAALCGISTDTWDAWVRGGFVPPATIRRGGVLRWHWPTVRDRLNPPAGSADADPFLKGIADVKAREATGARR
ncbi:MAG: hypothetical protein ACT6XS_17020 [Phreatobacter sp.]|uniref:hypothetical protein n=1 Tax=Phreatobacter sp. TaxID=1966341 RepID=UPI0040369B7B